MNSLPPAAPSRRPAVRHRPLSGRRLARGLLTGRRPRTGAVLALAALCAIAFAGDAGAGSGRALDARAAARPACFGAAARDPENPCVNRALAFVAIPSPYDAALEPTAPCKPIRHAKARACSFGVARAKAADWVALIGDSHAAAWRAAVAVVAGARQWHGVSLTRSECSFMFAGSPGDAHCRGWRGGVLRWLRAHPEVHSVVVGANAGANVITHGQSELETKIAAYIAAWKALPHTVRDVYVLADAPHSRHSTADCVAHQVARHRSPARHCSRKRIHALIPDASAIAATRTDSARVHLVDLSSFMCDAMWCFPVVGGALVIKDIGHLTRTFSTTLGPYLDRAIARLQGAAPPAGA